MKADYTLDEIEVKIRQKIGQACYSASGWSDDAQVFVCQDRPYTLVRVAVKLDGRWCTDIAFSKANWSDKFDSDFGIELCIHRCIKNIAGLIHGSVKGRKVTSDFLARSPEIFAMTAHNILDRLGDAEELGYGLSKDRKDDLVKHARSLAES